MSQSLATVAYLGAAILFILSLGGLSNPETSRRGNLFGMVGMALAVLATVFGPRVSPAGIGWIIGALLVGGSIGLYAAKVVKMTQMPELVALMHSLVGLAACLVGFASYVDTSITLTGAEKAIHEVEIYIGILIGAVTFSGSLIAFGKLNGKIGGKPLLLPARHWLNLAGLLVVIWFGREFINAHTVAEGMTPLIVMTVIALLFGIGLARGITGELRAVVDCFNALACPRIALDVPSGLDADTGAIVGDDGIAVRADRTVTFIGDKPGLHTAHGRDHAGIVHVDTLGIAPVSFTEARAFLNDPALFGAALPHRSHNTHKGSFGDIAIVGGAHGMAGAAILAARAAARGGAGRVFAGFADEPPAQLA